MPIPFLIYIVCDFSADLTGTFSLNYPKIPDSCRLLLSFGYGIKANYHLFSVLSAFLVASIWSIISSLASARWRLFISSASSHLPANIFSTIVLCSIIELSNLFCVVSEYILNCCVWEYILLYISITRLLPLIFIIY